MIFPLMTERSHRYRRWIAVAILVSLLCPVNPYPALAQHGGGHGAEGEEKEEGPPPLAKLIGHTELVYLAVYTPDEQRLISAGGDKTIRIWNASHLLTDKEKRKLAEEARRVAAEARKKRPWFWKRWFGKKEPAPVESHGGTTEATGHKAPPEQHVPVDEHHSAVQPEAGQHTAPAAHGPKLSLWKRLLSSFSTTRELPMAVPTPKPTPAPRFTPPPEATVEPSKELIRTIHDYPGQVLALAVTPDGQTLIAGGDTPQIMFFDLKSGRPRKTLQGHTDDVRSLALTPDGRLLASASADGTIRIWDMARGKTVKILKEDWLTHITFSHDGRLLAAASGTPPGWVVLWEVGSWRLRYRVNAHSDLVYWIAFSRDDRWFATAGEVQKGWETATGKPRMIEASLLELTPIEAVVEQAQGHAEGGGMMPKLIDKGEVPNERPMELRGHDKYAITVDISPPLVYYQPPTPKKKRQWRWFGWFRKKPPGPPEPDPTPPPPHTMPLIATGSIDDTIRIWDGNTGDTLAVVKAHKGHVSSVLFNKNGSILISTSWDKSVRAWDVMDLIKPKILEKIEKEKLEQIVREMRAKQKAAEEAKKHRKKKRFWLF